MHLVTNSESAVTAGAPAAKGGFWSGVWRVLVGVFPTGLLVRNGTAERRMRVIETLPLGPKRQLMLVSCDGENFLVGMGADQVHTILRVEKRYVEDSASVKETM